MNIAKLTSLTAMTLMGSLGVALAQTPSPGVATPTPVAHAPLTAAQVAQDTKGGSRTTGTSVKAALGWNFFHILYCEGVYSGSTFYLYFYPTTGGYWYTLAPGFQTELEPACQTGNWVGLFVVDASTGAYSNVNVYSYK